MKNTLKTYLPWLACVAVFYYIFRQIHPREVWQALQLANLFALLIYSVIYFILVYVLDVCALQYFLNRYATNITLKETFLVRGATYLLMILNFNAGQGAISIYLKKTHKASVSKTLGVLFFMTSIDLLLVITSAVLALYFFDVQYQGINLRDWALRFAPLVYIGFIAWIFFWKSLDSAWMQKLKQGKIIHWFLEHGIFHTFREVSIKDYLIVFAYRVPILIIVIGSINFAFFAFQSSVDWLTIYLYNPLIMLITTIPITPGGLGTGQVMAIEFFKRNITSPLFSGSSVNPENIILTSSLMWFLANQVLKAVVGMYCLKKTSKQLFEEK